jgi:hypothetical protein
VDLRPLDLDVVEKTQLDDVHAELRVLDGAESIGDLVLGRHSASLARSECDALSTPAAAYTFSK